MVAANPAAGGGAPDPEDIVALPTNADKGTFKKVAFPLHPGPAGYPWASACLEKARDAAELRALRVLNGMRVTVWQICVEKRRQYLSSMLGLGSPLTPLPPDCRGKILEFLPVFCVEYAGQGWTEMINDIFSTPNPTNPIVRVDFSGSGTTVRVVTKQNAGVHRTSREHRISLVYRYPLVHRTFVAVNRPGWCWWEDEAFVMLLQPYGYEWRQLVAPEVERINVTNADDPFVVSVSKRSRDAA